MPNHEHLFARGAIFASLLRAGQQPRAFLTNGVSAQLTPSISPANAYLQSILRREKIDTSLMSPVRSVIGKISPVIYRWANGYLISIEPSGSFAKGTGNVSGTDLDLFISLSPIVPNPLCEIYNTLDQALKAEGYTTRRQNVSININIDGWSVDLVPARRQNLHSTDHSIYRRKADTWTKTNVDAHNTYVKSSGFIDEIRIIKLWRDQQEIEWPSFYLELTVINALKLAARGDLATNVSKVFEFLRDIFVGARFIDPANSNNIISDDLTTVEKQRIATAASRSLSARDRSEIVR